MIEPRDPIDWFRVIWDLRRCRWSVRRLAAHIGIERSALYRAADGLDLRHHHAEAVLDAWSEVTRRPVSNAPRIASSANTFAKVAGA